MGSPQQHGSAHDRAPVPVQKEWLLEETLKSPRVAQREAERLTADPDRPKPTRRLRIAFLGTHGVPANYSGFEPFVEQISVRLAALGHDVTVYCRAHHSNIAEKTYKGVHRVVLPTIQSKQLDTIVHTFLSLLHGEFRRYDIVYICGVGSAPLAFIPRLVGVPSIVNVDGADWKRDKWGRFAKWYLRTAEWWSTFTASVIIADSRVVERYYLENYRKPTTFIPYGADVPILPP